jgi:hypothetical protein
MRDSDHGEQETSLVSTRTMEIVVALLFLLGSAIVLYDANRLGFGWREGEGPASGYFPFYIALIMAGASAINLLRAVLRAEPGADGIFVSRRAFSRVLAVLAPVILYVAAIQFFGIYVASAAFVVVFMIVIGRENPLKAVGVAVIVGILLFIMFEKWFLVPLPRCQNELCSGLEDTLIGMPYEWLRAKVQGLLQALNLVR